MIEAGLSATFLKSLMLDRSPLSPPCALLPPSALSPPRAPRTFRLGRRDGPEALPAPVGRQILQQGNATAATAWVRGRRGMSGMWHFHDRIAGQEGMRREARHVCENQLLQKRKKCGAVPGIASRAGVLSRDPRSQQPFLGQHHLKLLTFACGHAPSN